MVTQPWLPCQKLAAKFGVADVGKRMTAGGRTGFYLSCRSVLLDAHAISWLGR